MARHEGWNTYADGYDSAARDDEREFKRLDAEIKRLSSADDVLRREIEAMLREAQSVRSGADLVGGAARAHHEAGKIEAFQAVLSMIRKSS